MSVVPFGPRRPARAAMLGAATALALALAAPLASAKPAPESFAPLVRQVTPAVVNIQVVKTAEAGGDESGPAVPPGFEEFFKRFQQPGQQPKPPRKVGAVGSGFIVDPAGYVVTNNHVAAGASEIKVVLQDGRKLDGRLVGRDEKTDLALIKVESPTPLPFVAWGDSTRAEIGDWVLAVGNPFGLGGTVTAGIISARGRDIGSGPYDDFLQLDASINQGNSGGPSFDMEGKVIGVNTAIFSPTGGSVGIGFAIPASMARPVIDEIRARGRVERGWLGVAVQMLTPEIAAGLGLDAGTEGALVSQIDQAGPAAKSTLAQGDVIVSVDKQKVGAMRELPRLIAAVKPGEKVKLTVLRQGKEVVVPVTIGALPEGERVASVGEKPEPRRLAPTASAAGLTLLPLSPELRGRLGMKEDATGVLVSGVLDGSNAAEAGLAEGDVIVKAAGETVVAADDVEKRLVAAREAKRDSVLLVVARRGAERFVAIKLPGAAA